MKKIKDLTGLKKNMLTAKKFSERRNNKTYWIFKCDCGNEKEIDASKVFCNKNNTKSCGCYRKEIAPINNKERAINRKNVFINESSFINSLFINYKKNAINRNYNFNLSIEEFSKFIKNECFYCGTKESNLKKIKSRSIYKENYFYFKYNGIDRMDNNKGYNTENCVTCCKICNRAKNNMNIIDFINWINNLKKYNHKY